MINEIGPKQQPTRSVLTQYSASSYYPAYTRKKITSRQFQVKGKQGVSHLEDKKFIIWPPLDCGIEVTHQIYKQPKKWGRI